MALAVRFRHIGVSGMDVGESGMDAAVEPGRAAVGGGGEWSIFGW
jgi:hypothetical protein